MKSWDDRRKDPTFKIKGVAPELCDKFSKRSRERDAAIAEFIRDQKPSDNQIAVLVRLTRDSRLREISTEKVREHQRGQVTPEETRNSKTVTAEAPLHPLKRPPERPVRESLIQEDGAMPKIAENDPFSLPRPPFCVPCGPLRVPWRPFCPLSRRPDSGIREAMRRQADMRFLTQRQQVSR